VAAGRPAGNLRARRVTLRVVSQLGRARTDGEISLGLLKRVDLPAAPRGAGFKTDVDGAADLGRPPTGLWTGVGP
jgi:hypothetical protein